MHLDLNVFFNIVLHSTFDPIRPSDRTCVTAIVRRFVKVFQRFFHSAQHHLLRRLGQVTPSLVRVKTTEHDNSKINRWSVLGMSWHEQSYKRAPVPMRISHLYETIINIQKDTKSADPVAVLMPCLDRKVTCPKDQGPVAPRVLKIDSYGSYYMGLVKGVRPSIIGALIAPWRFPETHQAE